MAISAKILTGVKLSVTGSPDLGTTQYRMILDWGIEFTEGTGANQINQFWTDTRTLGASVSETIDLAGTLMNVNGSIATFSKVKFLGLKAHTDNAVNVILGGAASNAWLGPFSSSADTASIPAGGVWSQAEPVTGWTVTPTVADLLQVASGGASPVVYDIIIFGVG